ncbi:pyridoxal phosphate-dependent transferase [Epithele typhae]|uniref:pyridoxal phosphate-dependent transferase n=1 Tax=Epithele typhae TaxID=378194 RepID=UPI002007D27A|nr:pyridoxal phosphate-dependent transferase [Epithele typhae]KAH9921961.1 pyridoxal phosphate-dependent transferase [Epithele typhae]
MDAARAQVADKIKLDILSLTQEEDNKRGIREVSRSFLCANIVPTLEMYLYATRASVGDDVYHEPCTKALEAHMANITGKEAALFVPSGTMSNQLALRTHLKQPPYAVLCDHRSHIVRYEVGGLAHHSGAHAQMVIPSNGHHITLEDVKEHAVLGEEIHTCPTTVISLENTLNGTIMPQDEILRISEYAHSNGINMHLDGARIWHVAAETGTPLDELLAPFDTVSLCFSKGLGAPIGSCLVGSKQFIARARWFRKMFGGGMRQTGFMAGAAAYALTHNFPKLIDVHALTRKLETGLVELGVEIITVDTCMVFFDPSPIGVSYAEIVERASSLPDPLKVGGSRLVVHIQTSPEAVEDLLTVIRDLAANKKAAGFVPSVTKTNGLRSYNNVYVRGMAKH